MSKKKEPAKEEVKEPAKEEVKEEVKTQKKSSYKTATSTATSNNFTPLRYINYRGPRYRTLFNWPIYYKPHSLPSSQVGSSSSGGIIGAKKRRT